ncbi:DUF4097 family beta strand repeat protein [bacterium]|nr:DUF4097 family beta strand repeat protein [bacterium]
MHSFKYKFRGTVLAVLVSGMALWMGSCSIDDSCSSCNDAMATASFSHTLSASGIQRFSLSAVSGRIDISGTEDGDSVKVWGERMVRSKTQEDADQALSLLEVKIKTTDNEIGVETVQPGESNDRSYEVNYHVLIPQTMNVRIQSVNGETDVEFIRADVLMELVNGDILLDSITGSCQAALVNGRIRADVQMPDKALCLFSVVNGNIELAVPDTTSARFEASVVNGTIHVNGLQVQDMRTTQTMASGMLGDGSGLIQLQTVNGDINLRKRGM